MQATGRKPRRMDTQIESQVAQRPQAWRAWWFLLGHCFQRLARARLMLWIALGLLALFTLVVYVNYQLGRFNMANWRMPRRSGTTYADHLSQLQQAAAPIWTDPAQSITFAVYGAVHA